ncbi:hypothetical protein OIU84_016629 [Salix udensis]|uniref:Amino acid transporter transmembrane domain-containing protein n=1 Tax=Salix udensis TaxID=889485 RepID=A0AAD6JA55_9ROSI|nr:hypothetical protein OIU84_016629 [Salix udensis]
MWNQIRKSSGKLLFPESADCLSHRNIQVASETVHGEKLAPGWVTCDACVEESKLCKCDHSTQDLKSAVVDDADVENHPDHQANSSFAHSVINMIGMLIGLGQLSTPYALENGGWVSAFLLVGIGVICAYTSHLLGKCLDKSPKSRSYTDIGQHAFGSKGRVLATTFIYLEIFMALVSYTISLHDNLATVFAGTQLRLPAWASLYKSQLLTMMGVLVALPTLWLRDLSSISFLSSGGILMSIVIFTSVSCTAIFRVVKANHSIPALHLRKIPAISGLYIFSYAGHIVFPDLYKSMKDPSKFHKGIYSELCIGDSTVRITSVHGCQTVRPRSELSNNPEHAAASFHYKDCTVGNSANTHDKIRTRVRTIRHPARAQPSEFYQFQDQDSRERRRGFISAACDSSPSTFRSIFRACSQPDWLPRERQHLHSFPLYLLHQAFMAANI